MSTTPKTAELVEGVDRSVPHLEVREKRGGQVTAALRAEEARRRLLLRMRDEVAAIQGSLHRLRVETVALAEIERTRRLTPAERRRSRDLRLEAEAHRHRLSDLHTELAELSQRRAR
jgi:hypothetical protein